MKQFLVIFLASFFATAAYADCSLSQTYSLEEAQSFIHANYQGQMIQVSEGLIYLPGSGECRYGYGISVRDYNNYNYTQLTIVNRVCDLEKNWSGNSGLIICIAK